MADAAVSTTKLADNAVTSLKILDGTIQRDDVQSTFKAPYADTSDYAKAAIPGGSAGGDLTGTYPNPTIAAGAVTTAKIAAGAVTTTEILDGTIVNADLSSGLFSNITGVGTLGSLTVSGGANLATTSGNVGIGTTAPNRLLELSASGAEVTNLRLTNRSWTDGAGKYIGIF